MIWIWLQPSRPLEQTTQFDLVQLPLLHPELRVRREEKLPTPPVGTMWHRILLQNSEPWVRLTMRGVITAGEWRMETT